MIKAKYGKDKETNEVIITEVTEAGLSHYPRCVESSGAIESLHSGAELERKCAEHSNYVQRFALNKKDSLNEKQQLIYDELTNNRKCNISHDSFVKLVCFGLNMTPAPKSVSNSFATLYDMVESYNTKYKNESSMVTCWDAKRKDAFSNIRKGMIEIFSGIESPFIKEGFKLRLNSRLVEEFINSQLVLSVNTRKKSADRGVEFTASKMGVVYVAYCRVILHALGVTQNKEQKKKKILYSWEEA